MLGGPLQHEGLPLALEGLASPAHQAPGQGLHGLVGSPTAAFGQPRFRFLEPLEGTVQVRIGAVQVLQIHLAVDLVA